MWRYHKERSGESKATVPRILLVLLIYSGGNNGPWHLDRRRRFSRNYAKRAIESPRTGSKCTFS